MTPVFSSDPAGRSVDMAILPVFYFQDSWYFFRLNQAPRFVVDMFGQFLADPGSLFGY